MDCLLLCLKDTTTALKMTKMKNAMTRQILWRFEHKLETQQMTSD